MNLMFVKDEFKREPLPAYITAEQIAASIRMYRYNQDGYAAIMRALATSMYNEHYRHDGDLSDCLHDTGDELETLANALESAEEGCGGCGKCDSCVAARSDEHHDRKRDGEMMR